MCNNPGTPQQFQAGGPVKTQTLQDQEAGKDPIFDTIAGREFLIGTPGEFKPGIGDIAMGLARSEFDLPDQQVAGFTPEQMRAFGIAQEGVGSFQPFLSQASDLTQAGVAALDFGRSSTLGLGEQIPGAVAPGQQTAFQAAQDARGATMQGIGGLSQTGGMFDPSASQPFMNQFEDAAVQQALQDIARQGQIAGQGLRAQAVGSGAFGGSRQAVAEQELQRNVLGEQGRTAAGMRQAGFESAAARSQAAFEEAMRRQQAAASGIGQLGIEGAQAAGNLGLQGSQLGLSGIEAGLGAQQQAAGIGQSIAGLGQQMVGLGQAGQQFQQQDMNTLLATGGMQQQLEQAQMDAERANQFQKEMQPLQQLAFASDIIQGLPSGDTVTQLQPGPSFGSQAIGTIVGAGATAYNALNPQQPEQQFQAGGLVKTQPREAREKLRSMGGIMSSSPQLANTVAKFNVGGPIQVVDEFSMMPYGNVGNEPVPELAPRPAGREAQRAAIEALLEDPNLSEFEREALETRLLGLSGQGFIADAGTMVLDSLGRIISAPGRLAGAGLSAIGATGPGAALLEAFDAGFYDPDSPSYRNAPESDPTRGPDDGTRGGSPVAPTITEGPTRGPDDGTRGGSPVAPDVTNVPVEPARNEASRKLPPAETPAPDLDFEDPNTFDTNFKTVMSRLEGVMGTSSKSSREDAMANLAMIGFAIAAGQSPDALTNIAQGALTGMQAIRAEKRDREEQEKALRMLGITTAMDMTAARESADAAAARDELAFERGLITEAEKSRLTAERSVEELRLRAELGLGTGEGSVFNRSESPEEVFNTTLQTVRDAAPGTIELPEGMSQTVYAERLAAQDALRQLEGLVTMGRLTDPDQIAALRQLYQSRLDSTLTDAEREQALLGGS